MVSYDIILNLKDKNFVYYDKQTKISKIKKIPDEDLKVLNNWIDNYNSSIPYYLKKDEKYMIEFKDWFFLFNFFNINDNILQGLIIKKNIENKFLLIEKREKQLFVGELYQFL